MMLGIYKDLAPEWTARFLERAAAGHYDGTSFVSRRKSGDAAEPGEYAIRAAGADSRGLKAFDVANKACKSAPAQKERPVPVRMTTA